MMVRRLQVQEQPLDEQSLQAVQDYNENFDPSIGYRKRSRQADAGFDDRTPKRVNVNTGEENEEEQLEYNGEEAGWPPQEDLGYQDETVASMHNMWIDPSSHLRTASLPILDNLSIQLLSTLARGPYQDTINVVTQPESEPGQAYATLKSLFDQTKRMYSTEPFLSADDLNLREPDQRATIRKANLATFVSSVFGSQDVGFYHLNEHFLETFVAESGKLLKSQGALYLDLKTQAYISALSTGERDKEDILNDLFPSAMELFLLQRRAGNVLTPSEADFVSRARSRRDHLLVEAGDGSEEQVGVLMEKYVWQDFLRDVSIYISRNIESIVAPAGMRRGEMRRMMVDRALYGIPQQAQMQMPQQMDLLQEDGEDAVDARLRHALTVENAAHMTQGMGMSEEQANMAMSMGQEIPHTTQTAPTQVLYERARLAASAKASSSSSRRGGAGALPSQRRPWTTEEENALMAGLDHVRGPHWSQILALFGPGGTINEVLKDRNQVQLKDKARNLKLFFLKEGVEVPYYLMGVTGELKTRAPGVVSRKEKAQAEKGDDKTDMEAALVLGRGIEEMTEAQIQESQNIAGAALLQEAGGNR